MYKSNVADNSSSRKSDKMTRAGLSCWVLTDIHNIYTRDCRSVKNIIRHRSLKCSAVYKDKQRQVQIVLNKAYLGKCGKPSVYERDFKFTFNLNH